MKASSRGSAPPGEPTDPTRYAWEPVRTSDPDQRSLDRRLLLAIAPRTVWRQALDEAKRRVGLVPPDCSATATTGRLRGGRPDGTRHFGTIRKLPSGRWHARYHGPDGIRRTAPVTFERKGHAARWLAAKEAEVTRAEWRDP